MATVDAFEANEHLAQLLDRVAEGEEITITRHGKPIARLVPADMQARRPDVHRTIAEGHTRARFEQAMAKVAEAEPAPYDRLPEDSKESSSSHVNGKSSG